MAQFWSTSEPIDELPYSLIMAQLLHIARGCVTNEKMVGMHQDNVHHLQALEAFAFTSMALKCKKSRSEVLQVCLRAIGDDCEEQKHESRNIFHHI